MNTSIRQCLCLCGQNVAGKANYRPGHDARHAGQTGRAAVEAFDAGQGHWDSKEFYGHLPSPELRDKALRVARKAIEKRARAEAQGKAKGDANLSSLKGSRRTDDQPQVGTSEALTVTGAAKIGRWWYPARGLSNGTFERNTARDGSGEWVKIHARAFAPGQEV